MKDVQVDHSDIQRINERLWEIEKEVREIRDQISKWKGAIGVASFIFLGVGTLFGTLINKLLALIYTAPA